MNGYRVAILSGLDRVAILLGIQLIQFTTQWKGNTMAKVSYRIDDLDKTTAVEGDSTVLVLNGRKVTIDLSPANEAKLAKILAPYFDNGVVSEVKSSTAKPAADSQDRNAEIRTWAQANGHQVSDRGRLPGAVVKAYDEWEATQNVA